VRRQKQIWDTGEESKPRSDFLWQVMMCSNAFVRDTKLSTTASNSLTAWVECFDTS
jgi:hypothetical protein